MSNEGNNERKQNGSGVRVQSALSFRLGGNGRKGYLSMLFHLLFDMKTQRYRMGLTHSLSLDIPYLIGKNVHVVTHSLGNVVRILVVLFLVWCFVRFVGFASLVLHLLLLAACIDLAADVQLNRSHSVSPVRVDERPLSPTNCETGTMFLRMRSALVLSSRLSMTARSNFDALS